AVDVSAQDCINRKFLRVTNDLFFEAADEADRIFHSFFCVGAERPIAQSETAAHEIDQGIKREQKLVANVARKREPLHVLHDGVELMPVNDEHAAAINQTMNGMLLHGDVAVSTVKLGQQVVMIARDVNDACAFARLPQTFLDDVVVLLWTITSAARLRVVNHIAVAVDSCVYV